MKPDDEIIWLLLGSAIIMLGATGEKPNWGTGWHYPVPDYLNQQGRFPAVASQEFKGSKVHGGLDILLSRRGTSHAGQPVIVEGFPPGKKAADGITTDADASGKFFAPKGLWILAARAAKVWRVVQTVNGIWVELDHGPPWATAYGHLETCRLKPTSKGESGEQVAAGEIIGTMGAGLNTDPTAGLVDHQHLRHLHFEAWYKGDGSHAVDPESEMRGWKRSVWQ
jgi:murein DD-endopeptidase MepM/ murein hydrolase activator NlpD